MERLSRSARMAGLMFLVSVAILVPSSVVSARPPIVDRPSTERPWASKTSSTEWTPRPSGTASVSQLATVPQGDVEPCADDPAWLCGSVTVPLDRAHPADRKIDIGFEILPHSGPGPGAHDAIIVTAGGPGIATTPDRGYWQFLMGPLLEERDLLLVDSRGTGKSAPIDCPELQSGVSDSRAEFIAAVGACGEQLGEDADRYGNGDVALDVEAVRRTLGYPRLSYYGPSYGSVAVQAYAVRFPERVRVAVVDAGLPVADFAHSDTWGLDFPRAMARTTALGCLQAPSPACAAAQPRARQALADLARMVREHPVDGTAGDLSGTLRSVHVDELTLIEMLTAGFPGVMNAGELAAVSAALSRGDEQPLIRLAAELFQEGGEPPDPAFFSDGANAAAFCNDLDFVWHRRDSVSVKRDKFRQGVRDLGPDRFAPFSNGAWFEYFFPDYCLLWPAPDRFVPAVPREATVTGTPALLMGGQIDVNVPAKTTRRLLGVFLDATYVNFAGAAHTPAAWSDCARTVMQRFIRTLRAGNTSCAKEPAFRPPAVPDFPLKAGQAAPARSRAGDASTVRDRKVATIAVQAAIDAFLRSFRTPFPSGTVRGLRAGTVDYSYGDGAGIHELHGVRFSRDVVVDGTMRWGYDAVMTMTLTVDGPGGHDGMLEATGTYGFGEPYRDFRVTGEIGGRALAAKVPAR